MKRMLPIGGRLGKLILPFLQVKFYLINKFCLWELSAGWELGKY